MKSFRRWLVSGAGSLLFLLFLTLCVAWISSSVRGDALALTFAQRTKAGGHRWEAVAEKSYFCIILTDEMNPTPISSAELGWHAATRNGNSLMPNQWFSLPLWDAYRENWIGPGILGQSNVIRIQFWILSLVLGSLAALSYLILRRPRFSLPNNCVVCGYDLRATPGRCPECGTIPPPKNEIAAT
jgi:hypothetical protein